MKNACKSGLHCYACRNSEDQRIKCGFPKVCPRGFNKNNLPKEKNMPKPKDTRKRIKELFDKRFEICDECEHYSDTQKCCRIIPEVNLLCGIKNPLSFCPENKWQAENIDDYKDLENITKNKQAIEDIDKVFKRGGCGWQNKVQRIRDTLRNDIKNNVNILNKEKGETND